MPASPLSFPAFLALVTLPLVACASRSSPAPSPSPSAAATTSAASDSAAPPSAPAAPTAPATPAPDDATVAAFLDELRGPWAGSGESPFGQMPFAVLFERQPDGSLRSWADDAKGTNIDLLFHRTAAGWRLTESASLPGVGTQRYTLAPTLAEPTRLVLHYPEQPELLTIELSVIAAGPGGATPSSASSGSAPSAPSPKLAQPRQLRLVARVRGEDHIDFLMRRLPDEATEKLRRNLQPPGTAPSIASSTLAP